jgi:hypothetical protein
VPTFIHAISPDVVDVLRHEHERVRQLCADMRGAGRDRQRLLLAALLHAVRLHLLGELAVVHPAVRDTAADGDRIALASRTDDERLARSLIELGRLGVRHTAFDDSFAAVAGALSAHAERQERQEFPLLRNHVPVQRLHMMASAMTDVRIIAAM